MSCSEKLKCVYSIQVTLNELGMKYNVFACYKLCTSELRIQQRCGLKMSS